LIPLPSKWVVEFLEPIPTDASAAMAPINRMMVISVH
jgi:hypothetical protein